MIWDVYTHLHTTQRNSNPQTKQTHWQETESPMRKRCTRLCKKLRAKPYKEHVVDVQCVTQISPFMTEGTHFPAVERVLATRLSAESLSWNFSQPSKLPCSSSYPIPKEHPIATHIQLLVHVVVSGRYNLKDHPSPRAPEGSGPAAALSGGLCLSPPVHSSSPEHSATISLHAKLHSRVCFLGNLD